MGVQNFICHIKDMRLLTILLNFVTMSISGCKKMQLKKNYIKSIKPFPALPSANGLGDGLSKIFFF
jgi:hypothetical protein